MSWAVAAGQLGEAGHGDGEAAAGAQGCQGLDGIVVGVGGDDQVANLVHFGQRQPLVVVEHAAG